MPIYSINQIKQWFRTNLKPTELQFWAWLDSYWHKEEKIPAASIENLQQLLDAKVDKKDIKPQSTVYVPTKDYIYNPELPEYVSFSNPQSGIEQFKKEGYYRLTENAYAGENPETHPQNWKYQGQTLGEIAIGDVVGLTEAINDKDDKTHHTSLGWVADKAELRGLAEAWGDFTLKDDDTISLQTGEVYYWDSSVDNTSDDNNLVIVMTGWSGMGAFRLKFKLEVGGNSLTPEQVAAINSIPVVAQTANNAADAADEAQTTVDNHKNATIGAHPLSTITPDPAKAQYILMVAADGTIIGYTAFRANQVLSVASMDTTDPNWLAEQSRLFTIIKNADGTVRTGSATEMMDKNIPPATLTALSVDSGWVNEQKTITGDNSSFAIGREGQTGWLDDKTFVEVKSATYTTNASVTFYRNRAIDALNISDTEDSLVMDRLDPSRTGGSVDDGWNLVTNTKVITDVPCRVGTWWAGGNNGEGYMYHIYKASGSTYYAKRNGQAQSIQRKISTSAYPNLTAHLLAFDFTSAVYTKQAGDETFWEDQYFYNSATRAYYIATSNSTFDKLR